MPAPANLVHELSTTTGAGDFTLIAINGKVRFSDATYAFDTGVTTDVFDYFISNRGASEWEIGTGHMSDANTLVRDTVVFSSNSNNAVNFSAGTKDITNDIPAASQVRQSEIRERLAADRDYFVDADNGDDGNDGLSAGAGAFATIQKAIDIVSETLDLGIWDVTINVADDGTAGAYDGFVLKSCVGAGFVFVVGNETTPANVLIDTAAANSPTGATELVVGADLRTRYHVRGMRLNNASAFGIRATGSPTRILFRNMEFGACGAAHMRCDFGALLEADGDYTISGNAARHWHILQQGNLLARALTITLSGTPAFSSVFAASERHGQMNVDANTFSGSATGKRFDVKTVSVIYTNGGGATYFPGDSSGTEDTATSGHYV